MGILQNLFNVLSGKQRNHIYHDQGGTWGFATSNTINIKRIEADASFALVFEGLFKEGCDYVLTGQLTASDGLSADTMANQRMVQWQTGTNRLVGYSKITASNGQPACCGYSGILKDGNSENRILQLEYFGYAASGKELYLTMCKKCPASLIANMASVDYTHIVKEMNDVYAMVTSIRIQ